MRPTLAIARLTIWEGLRMGIVLVFILVLVGAVLVMPFTLTGDGTLAGRLQSVLKWSLGALSFFLSLATVFMSCATLAGEIRTRSIHMVVTKPVSRAQILVGKWLGINFLNVLLVALCGATIYAFASFIAQNPAINDRDRKSIDNVIWTARATALPVPAPGLEQAAEDYVEQKIRTGSIAPEQRAEAVTARKRDLLGQWRTLEPGEMQVYQYENLGTPAEDAITQVRFKAVGIPIPVNEQLFISWIFLDPTSGQSLQPVPFTTDKRSGDMHQFLVQSRIIRDGKAAVVAANPADLAGKTKVSFESQKVPYEGGIIEAPQVEILYTIGTFEANFCKTLLLILLQLAFLSAVGLLFGAFVSFPIACLCAMSTYLFCLGWNWWWEAIGANMQIRTEQIDPYGRFGPLIRFFLKPIMKVFPNFTEYSGVGRLVEGEYIAWTLVGSAAASTLLFGLVLLFIGWLVFRSREIAEVTA